MSQLSKFVIASGPGSGTVTSISAGTGITLTPNPITTTGTVALTIPVVIANGGTNATSFANTDGVVYFDGTRLVNTTVGTSGQVLTSNGVGLAPTFQNASGGGIVTIDGDTGSITGSTVTIEAGVATLNSGSTVQFTNSGTTSTFNVSDTNLNTIIGHSAGSASAGLRNTGLGYQSLQAVAGGNLNTCIGFQSGAALGTGNSNNIDINAPGVSGDNHTLRIGAGTGTGNQQLTAAFISGIDGVNVGSVATVVTEAADKLGTAVLTAGTGITITPTANVITISASGGSGITTIDGDTGSVTGSTVSIKANSTAGETISFSGSGTAMVLNVSDGSGNTFFGLGAGKTGQTSNQSSGFGASALTSITSGNYNNAFGNNSLFMCTTGIGNVGMGTDCLFSNVGGNYNFGLGFTSLFQLNGGSGNICIGYQSGYNYTSTESNNILLCSSTTPSGTVGESNVLRIGNGTGSGSGNLSSAFISGINGVTSSNPLMVTIDSVTDQLGVAAIPSGGITTIDGDSGSITGSTVTIYANTAGNNCGSSVSFVNSGTTSTLNVTDANGNTLIGQNAGNASIVANGGSTNVGLGDGAGHGLTSGTSNNLVGNGAGFAMTTDTLNTAMGEDALRFASGSGSNTAIGSLSLFSLVSGNNNVAIGGSLNGGVGSGGNYTGSESNNICINSLGIAAENYTLHIGTGTGSSAQGNLTAAFISGINGNTVSNTKYVTINSSTDQLGVVSSIPTPAASVSFLAIATTNQTVTAGSTTQINFASAIYNNGSTYASNQFTAPNTGIYTFNINVNCTNASTGDSVTLYLNGSPQVTSQDSFVAAVTGSVSFKITLSLAATNTVAIAYNNAGAISATIKGQSSPYITWFEGYQIA